MVLAACGVECEARPETPFPDPAWNPKDAAQGNRQSLEQILVNVVPDSLEMDRSNFPRIPIHLRPYRFSLLYKVVRSISRIRAARDRLWFAARRVFSICMRSTSSSVWPLC